jgi:hypothetical protein
MTGRKKTVKRQKSGGRRKTPASSAGDYTKRKAVEHAQKVMREMLLSEVQSLAYVMKDEKITGEVMRLYDDGQYSAAAQALEGYAESTMDPVLIRGAKSMAKQVALVSRPNIVSEELVPVKDASTIRENIPVVPLSDIGPEAYEEIAKTPASGGGWSADRNGLRPVDFMISGKERTVLVDFEDRMSILHFHLGKYLGHYDWYAELEPRQDVNSSSVRIKITVPIDTSDIPLRNALDHTFMEVSPHKTFGSVYPLGQTRPRWLDIPDRDPDRGVKHMYYEITNNLE